MAVRIMLADDSELVRGILRNILLSHERWEVCGEVENGEAAVAKANELRPDVIILDLKMPGVDGLAAARTISEFVPDTRIIMHTLHASEQIELEPKQNGVLRVLPKSKGAELVVAVQEVLTMEPPTGLATPAPSTKSLPGALPAIPAQTGPDNPAGEFSRPNHDLLAMSHPIAFRKPVKIAPLRN